MIQYTGYQSVFAWSGEIQHYLVLIGPSVQFLRDEFAAIIDLDTLWNTSFNLLQMAQEVDDISSLDLPLGVKSRAFLAVIVHDSQNAKPAAVK